MKKKIIILIPVLLVVGFVGYKMFGPKPPEPKHKIEGPLVKMDPEFLINLSGGSFAKMTVAMELKEEDPLAEELLAAGGGHGGGGKETPPHPQNDAIRALVTAEFTGQKPDAILDPESREALLLDLKKRIDKKTDAKVKEVMITDITVD